MKIRKSTIEDINHIQKIYDYAREYMISQGNTNQWTNGYPDYDTIKTDIEKSQSYVCIDEDNTVVGVFVFYIGNEEDYNNIEGTWLNNDEYGVVHRIATNKKGVGSFCLRYCFEQINNIKIDTHQDNISMQKLLEKEGYTKCGIITLKRNGAKRIAFQKV